MPAFRNLTRPHPLTLALATLVLGAGLSTSVWAQPSAPTPSSAVQGAEVPEIQRLIKDGQHAQALKLIDEALARNPKDPQMRFRRGVALSMLDRKSEALAVFQKLVEDHPDMPAPYNNMAVIYGAQGDYEKARGALERAIRTNPAYATAYQNLGDVYAQLASQAYTKALQLDKTDRTVPPKLSLLRELTSGTPAAPSTSVAAAAPAAVPAPAKSPAPTLAAAEHQPVQAATKPPAPSANGKPAAETRPVVTADADVERAVKSWASAWSRRDMNSYYAAYTAEFSGQAGSHKAWQKERHDRIATKKSIRVGVSDLKITVNGDRAVAHFRQTYQSDALSSNSRKTLEFTRSGGRWLIRQESIGG